MTKSELEIELNRINNITNLDEKIYEIRELLSVRFNYKSLTLLIELLINRNNEGDLSEAKNLAKNAYYGYNKDYYLMCLSKIARKENNNEEMIYYLELAMNTKCRANASYFLGNYYLDLFNNYKAEYYFEICYEIINKKDKCIYNLAKCKYFLKKFDEALKLFEEYIDINENQNKDKAYLYIARILIVKKDYEKAVYYLNLIKDTKIMDFVKAELAKVEVAKGNYDLAREQFLDISEKNSSKDFASYQIARSYLLENKYDEALIILEKLRNSKVRKYALMDLAKIYKIKKNYELEKDCYQEILKNGYDKYALFELARVSIEENDSDFAKKLLNQILDNEYDEFTLFRLSKIYYDEGKYELAKESLLKIKKKNKYVLLELGKTEICLKNINEAINYFNLILNEQYDEYAILELAKTYKLINKEKESLDLFNSLLLTNSTFFALYYLAKIDIEKKDYINALKKLLLIDKNGDLSKLDFTQLYLYISKCQYELNNIELSDYYYKKHLEYNHYDDYSENRKSIILSLM